MVAAKMIPNIKILGDELYERSIYLPTMPKIIRGKVVAIPI